MNETNALPGDQTPKQPELSQSPLFAPILAGLLAWIVILLGFLGLKELMNERPEFVGPPMRATQVELVQESPQTVIRKMSDDVSAIKPMQPEASDVNFDMSGRRDYRGLRTTLDMSGYFHARYVLTNAFEEPVFALFKCPHPRAQDGSQNLLAGDLKLQAAAGGWPESTKDAWIWSGAIESHAAATVEISYHVAALKGVAYHVSDTDGNQVKQLRVAIQRKDIPAMRFESGDGTRLADQETVTWERKDFLAPDFFAAHISEGRNLFDSLSQLLQIGPVVCLLFLVAVSSMILVRQPLTAVQMLTIAAGYAVYFPLILYLSARFSFVWALVIAFVVPGALLVNYARWLVRGKAVWLGAPLVLALYQVFPTLAAFAGWNRGMLLLCLGLVTLAVLINLQNQSLRRKAAAVAALLPLLLLPGNASGGEVQVILPAELAGKISELAREPTNPLVAFDPAQYHVREEAGHFRIEAQLPFQVLRAGETAVPLFNAPVYLEAYQIEPGQNQLAQLIVVSNRLALFTQGTGPGNLHLVYRVPIVNHEGRQRAEIPVACASAGNMRLESPRNDYDILTGSLWAKTSTNQSSVYDIGVAGDDLLVIECSDQLKSVPPVNVAPTNTVPINATPTHAAPAEAAKEFYGIGITRAQHLTVIASDGSCTHFSEFELPAYQNEEFRIELPPDARLISVSVNGNEINSPAMQDGIYRVPLPSRQGQQTSHRLSFRIAYPAVRLGFVGELDLVLPEVFQTAGTLEWVVALPDGFETQVISSGLERQKTSPDLSSFGDYGRILQQHAHTALVKDLAPPGAVELSLKYRQMVAGFYEAPTQ